MNELSTTHLLRDHRETEKVLVLLQALLEAPSMPWSEDWGHVYENICRFFDRDVLCHIRKEDEALFPVLEEFLPRDVGPLAVLRGEHADISTYYAQMRHAGDALRRGTQNPQATEDFQRNGRRLVGLIKDHVYKEDRVLYPMVARFLSADQDRHILEHMEALTPLKSIANAG